MNLLLFPDTYEFSFKPSKKKQKWKNGKETGNQLYDFEYVETFKKFDTKMAERTFLAVEPLRSVGINVERLKKGFRVWGTLPRESIASAIVGEFFNHSAIGMLTLGQLFQGMTVGTLAAEKMRTDAVP